MRRPTIIALCLVLGAIWPGVAVASSPSSSASAVIADCQSHNKLTGSYCQDVIQSQLLTQAKDSGGGSGSGSGSGGSFLPTPVIVIIVVLALGGITFGAFEVRRRRSVS
jgi:hypothetical protein